MLRLAPRATARLDVPGTSQQLSQAAFTFLAVVAVVQGVHVVEHVLQLIQVYVLSVAEDDALGLLGYLIQFNGTEEWLHLGFNSLYLAALCALIIPLWRITPQVLPMWAFAVFVLGSVWLETWHVIEHGVIISNVIANGGCPCPGIGDAALGVTDTILHFVYNVLAYTGVAIAFVYALRACGADSVWRAVWPGRPRG